MDQPKSERLVRRRNYLAPTEAFLTDYVIPYMEELIEDGLTDGPVDDDPFEADFLKAIPGLAYSLYEKYADSENVELRKRAARRLDQAPLLPSLAGDLAIHLALDPNPEVAVLTRESTRRMVEAGTLDSVCLSWVESLTNDYCTPDE